MSVSMVSDHGKNLFKNRLVENVSTIQLIAFFSNSPPRFIRIVTFAAVFFRLNLSVLCAFLHLNIQTPFQFDAFFFSHSCAGELECTQASILFHEKRFKRIFYGIMKKIIASKIAENLLNKWLEEIHCNHKDSHSFYSLI